MVVIYLSRRLRYHNRRKSSIPFGEPVWLRLGRKSVAIARLSSQLLAPHCYWVLAGLVERRLEPNPGAQVEPQGLLGFFERRERCHLPPFHAQKVGFFASQPVANEWEAHRPFKPENGRKLQYFPVLSRREGILEYRL